MFARGRPLTALEATFFAIMMLMVIVWLCLCEWTFRRLSTRRLLLSMNRWARRCFSGTIRQRPICSSSSFLQLSLEETRRLRVGSNLLGDDDSPADLSRRIRGANGRVFRWSSSRLTARRLSPGAALESC